MMSLLGHHRFTSVGLLSSVAGLTAKPKPETSPLPVYPSPGLGSIQRSQGQAV